MLTSAHSTQFPPSVYWSIWSPPGAAVRLWRVSLCRNPSPMGRDFTYYLLSAVIEHLKYYDYPWPVKLHHTVTPEEGEIIAKCAAMVGQAVYCPLHLDSEEV